LRALGCTDIVLSTARSARGLLDALSRGTPQAAVFPHGNLALRTIPEGLRALGWQVTEGVVYETSTVDRTPASVELIRRRDVAAIILRSPSAVRALTSFITPDPSIPIICAGRTTAEAAAAKGLNVAAIATSTNSTALASATSTVLGVP
jgi:uroporphyrinogen-III synthase